LVKLGNVDIDGTKRKANASTHRSVDYQKISEREQHWRSEVERLLNQAQHTDQEEDQRFGVGQPADPLADDLASAQKRLQRLQQAKTELEQQATEQLQAVGALPLRKRGHPSKEEQTSQPPKDRKQREKEKKQRQRARENAAAPGRQYNFVDPDSRVMRDNGQKCFVQAYNVQIAVDARAQVIVAAELAQQTIDRQQLLPLVKSVCSTAQVTPETMDCPCGHSTHGRSVCGKPKRRSLWKWK
jgi:hypothetical protein